MASPDSIGRSDFLNGDVIAVNTVDSRGQGCPRYQPW